MSALIAGFGNIFYSDDGYGSEACRCLAAQTPVAEARILDFGIRGMHVAFEMLNGYGLVIFLDAMKRGEVPGTLTVIEPHSLPATAPDGHAMELHNALSFYESLCRHMNIATRPHVLIVGCEPQSLHEGIGLTSVVEEAVTRTPALVFSLLARFGMGVPANESQVAD